MLKGFRLFHLAANSSNKHRHSASAIRLISSAFPSPFLSEKLVKVIQEIGNSKIEISVASTSF
jgi:hypothetical protein